jgi:AraC-like DNA-binding protein
MNFFLATGLYTGPLIIAVLLYHSIRKNMNNVLLVAALACTWYSFFMAWMNYSGNVFNYPYLMRTGIIAIYLTYPLLLLYIKNTFYPGRFWRRHYWFFFIPAALYIIDMLPFYLADVATKSRMLKTSLSDMVQYNQVIEGWFAPPGFHFILMYLYSAVLCAASYRLVYINRKNNPRSNGVKNKKIYFFIVWLVIMYTPPLFPGIIIALSHKSWISPLYSTITINITLVSVVLFLLISPEIIYGYLTTIPLPVSDTGNDAVRPSQIVKNTIEPTTLSAQHNQLSKINPADGEEVLFEEDAQRATQAIAIIENLFTQQQPFTQPGYSIHDLSKDSSIPVYQLSMLINRHYHTNFNRWINTHRVNYFLSIIEQPTNKNLTLEAVAKLAGFSNRVSFSNAFKKEKGVTPSLFFKKNVLG